MGYARLYHGYYMNPKFDGLTPRAERTWTRALAYADEQLTDGAISRQALRHLDGTVKDARALVASGLWEETSTGWQIHNYLVHNMSAEAISQQRRANAERQRRHRERNALRNASHDGGQYDLLDEIAAESWRNSDQIDTTQQTKTSPQTQESKGSGINGEKSNASRNAPRHRQRPRQDFRGEVGSNRKGSTQTPHNDNTDAATTGAPGTWPDHCSAHRHTPPHEVPPCTACANTRLARQAAADDDAHRRAAARRSAIRNCSLCDDAGWEIDPRTGVCKAPAVKCTHDG